MNAPVFNTVSGMFDAMFARQINGDTEVACGHCPWMGVAVMFPPHLLGCPDQSPTVQPPPNRNTA